MEEGIVEIAGPPSAASHKNLAILSSFSRAPLILSSHRSLNKISSTACSVVLVCNCWFL